MDTSGDHLARRLKQLRQQRRFLAWRRRLAFWLGALLVGLVALAFAWLADRAYALFHQLGSQHPWLPWVLTPGGFALLAWATQGWLNKTRGSGIDKVIALQYEPSSRLRNAALALPVALAKMCMTVFALFCGASVGREGPTVHIGAALMYIFGRRLGLHTQRACSDLIVAGGAAGIAAAFNAPLAGVAFAIEELSPRFEKRLNGMVLTAVLIGGMVTLGLLGYYSYFGNLGAALPLLEDAWLAVILCGLAGGALGGLYCRLVLPASSGLLGLVCSARRRHPVLFAALCGLLLAALGACSGQHVFGTGYEETRALLDGSPETSQSFIFWKFLANVISFLTGIPGGLFSPSLSVGAGMAPWLTSWIPGIDLQTAGLLGMAAYLSGVTAAPLTATLIIVEMSHSPDMMLPILGASLLANAVSGQISPVPLYRALARQLLAEEPGNRPAAGAREGGTHAGPAL